MELSTKAMESQTEVRNYSQTESQTEQFRTDNPQLESFGETVDPLKHPSDSGFGSTVTLQPEVPPVKAQILDENFYVFHLVTPDGRIVGPITFEVERTNVGLPYELDEEFTSKCSDDRSKWNS